MGVILPISNAILDKQKGAFKPCLWCGGTTATFEQAPEIAPAHHAARVKCENCGRQIAWSSERQVRRAERLVAA